MIFPFLESQPKKAKTTAVRKTPPQPQPTLSYNWNEDPRAIVDLLGDQQSPVPEYRRSWHQIRTRFSRQNRLLYWYNFRLSSLQTDDVLQHLNQIFNDQFTVFGFILRNNETGEL